MKHFLILAFFFPLMWLGPSKNINGTYQVVYDKGFTKHPNFVINFRDSVYVRTVDNSVILKGRISFSDRESRLAYLIDSNVADSNKKQDSTSLSYKMQRSFGNQIIEVKIKNLNNILFRTTYSANLHVTVNTGVLKRVK